MTPAIERLDDRAGRYLDGLLADSERAGSRIVRRLVDEWRSGVNRFDRPGEALFGAWVDGQLIGVCGLNIDPYAADDRVGRVRHLYVSSARRGHGVGRRLVAHVVRAARGRFDVLYLRTNSPAAARLYESAGFDVCRESDAYTHVMGLAARASTTEPLLARLRGTPDTLERALSGKTDAELSRRPDVHNWSSKEIVCHLRDVEELFQIRFHTVIALDEPRLLVLGASATDLASWRIGGPIGHPLDPGRWAEERQYLRNDTHEALAAFRRRRTEVLTLLGGLSPAEWQRGGIHPSRGRLTIADWASALAAHDDNHVDQLRRALDGRP